MNLTTGRILFGVTLVGLGLSGCGTQMTSRGSSNASNPAMVQEQLLSLNNFQRIRGTRYLKAEITQEQPSRGLSSSSGSGRMTRNLVFLDGDSLDSHKLFEQNSYLIVASTEYPTNETATEPTTKNVATGTQWLVYEVIKSDTNGNGQIDFQDQVALSFRMPAVRATPRFFRVLIGAQHQHVHSGKLIVVYTRASSRSASIVD